MIKAADLIEQFKYALDNHWGYIWGTAGIQWTEAKQKQKVNYMVSKYGSDWKKNKEAKDDNYYYAALYGSKWIGHTVADCSGLFVWAYKKYGASIYHGSNSIYDRYCSKKGKLNDSLKKTLKPGTAVFTGDEKKHGHIGLYVGNGKVIEASGTQAGVCTSNITDGKWTYYGELKDVQLDGASPVYIIQKGDKGEEVKKIQKLLLERGYKLPKYGADGDFGSETEAAVKAFQKDWGLKQDGIVGEETLKMLESVPAKEKRYSVTVTGLTLSQAKALCDMYQNSSYKELI